MKFYEKEYEDVFSGKRFLNKCKIENVSIDNSDDVNEYKLLFRRSIRKYEKDIFDHWIKIAWLMRRFCYHGKQRRKFRANGVVLDGAFSIFMKREVGYDLALVTRNTLFNRISTYFEDFFPGFDTSDPFKTKYEYPYQNVNLEYLMLVYQMPERLDLLDYAEKRKLSYLKFQDYVLNHIHCANEEVGEERFVFSISTRWVSYIKYKNYEG